MIRIGVISDPHGCLVGLRTGLDWLRDRGVGFAVCAGDVASFGPQPNECVAVLAERGIPTVRGNSDRDLIRPRRESAGAGERAKQLATIEDWCRARLTPDSVTWLASLPDELRPAPDVLIVHGAPGNPEAIVSLEDQAVFPRRVTAVAAGHLHVPFILRPKGGLWVNAGSVGRPCDGDPRAAVAILELEPSGWDASIYRIPFDLEAAARAIRGADMPYTEQLIKTQEQACWW